MREAAVLDLFAGTGAFGLEALSRGARQAVFVDNSPFALDLIHQNITICAFSDKADVIRHDLTKGLVFGAKSNWHHQQFDIIFLDPPYRQGLGLKILNSLLELNLIAEGGVVIVEDDSTETLPEAIGQFVLYDKRSYGDTGFWLYEQQPPAIPLNDTPTPPQENTPPRTAQ